MKKVISISLIFLPLFVNAGGIKNMDGIIEFLVGIAILIIITIITAIRAILIISKKKTFRVIDWIIFPVSLIFSSFIFYVSTFQDLWDTNFSSLSLLLTVLYIATVFLQIRNKYQ